MFIKRYRGIRTNGFKSNRLTFNLFYQVDYYPLSTQALLDAIFLINRPEGANGLYSRTLMASKSAESASLSLLNHY